MTDPQRPLTRREARELRRAQEETAQQHTTPRPQETPGPAETPERPARSGSAQGRPAQGGSNAGTQPTPGSHAPSHRGPAPQGQGVASSSSTGEAPARRRHGRRRSDGPVDGGIPRIPKLAPEPPVVEAPPVHTPEPDEDDQTAQHRPVAPAPSEAPAPPVFSAPEAPAATPESVQQPPIVEPAPMAEPGVPPRTEGQAEPADRLPPVAPPPVLPAVGGGTEDDDATQLGLPPIVSGGRVPPVPEPIRDVAQGHPAQTAEVQAALSRHAPRQLDPEQLAELDHARQRSIREALDRHQQPSAAASDAGAAPSFSELLGLAQPGTPSSAGQGRASRRVEAKPLSPAVAPLNSPQQRELENTGLVAPVTSTVPVVFSSASSATPAHDGQAAPLHARQAHGLDPLEYRVSGVKRTRAGLAVVVGSVVVAAAAVILAINL